MKRFEGKVALVTGGNAGIGLAAAVAFAAEGARVAVAARRQAEGAAAVEAIREAGGDAIFIRTDVTQPQEVEAMVARTVEAFGRLDCAFNNAGVEGPGIPAPDYSVEEWDRVIDVNLKGVWLCMKYELPHMARRGGGSIVNMSSVLGLVAYANTSAYTAAKHGVVGLTKAAALECAREHIRINAVCPASVVTPMFDRHWGPESSRSPAEAAALHPVGRVAAPEEIAAAVLWLCSDAASYVNGHALALDGAWSAR